MKTDNLEDDDSENDSDYDPNADPDVEIEDSEQTEEKGLKNLSFSRRRKAEDYFKAMMEEDSLYIASIMKNAHHSDFYLLEKMGKRARNRCQRKKYCLLRQLFGKSVAQSYLGPCVAKKSINSEIASRKRKLHDEIDTDDNTGRSSVDVKELIASSVRNVKRKTTVVEKRKFAGQEIEYVKRKNFDTFSNYYYMSLILNRVERTIMNPQTSLESKSGQVSSLDQAIEAIKGPKSISTVSKSSLDWDNFKEKEKLEDDLSGASKEG